MTEKQFDVLGIGNAIVDVLSRAEESFLVEQRLDKGAMRLIEAGEAERLYGLMGPGIEMSGGSAGNTLHGIASLGGKAAFIGKVRDDTLGQIFRHDMQAAGVHFTSQPATDGPPTARCLILVTPDGQRTMNTYLGACVELTPEDVDPVLVAASAFTYLEGYLWDPPQAKAAFLKAANTAHEAGRKVALSLSDSFCVERHRREFRALVEKHVDVLFANEDEIKSLFEVSSFDDALQAIRGQVEIAALTRSEKGAVIVAGPEVHVIDAEPVDKLVDTTGAGDLYASGFLYGLTRGLPVAVCGTLGAVAAAEIISHFGARPEVSLAELIADKVHSG
ncbi:MAG: adenosine kinase [Alphaproteobacteria bacterium]|nr:adenosine kinase [Alphaproteobacteria bacterium]MBU0796596.1 adenosine kinase [Alphaproteobacteria bacterium]MBU0886335.1 adenosine kinase [Alphaproteobacteria bacterium]MBU1813469.1 adenosine kinase [Alphaproteobacteria bacterium]MBU2090222.1 adenosine kinase [Alphaproteobacteria bacterium]